MSVNNNEFYELLKIQRPELSESSLKTYTSILYNLYLRNYGEEQINPANFNNVSKTSFGTKLVTPRLFIEKLLYLISIYNMIIIGTSAIEIFVDKVTVSFLNLSCIGLYIFSSRVLLIFFQL